MFLIFPSLTHTTLSFSTRFLFPLPFPSFLSVILAPSFSITFHHPSSPFLISLTPPRSFPPSVTLTPSTSLPFPLFTLTQEVQKLYLMLNNDLMEGLSPKLHSFNKYIKEET